MWSKEHVWSQTLSTFSLNDFLIASDNKNDPNFLLKKISELNEEIINNSLIKFTIKENNQLIDIFFDIKNYELIGWQTKDIYQNTAVTLLYSIKLNQVVDEKIFKTPLQN